MGENSQIGIFWGEDSIHVVESAGKKASKLFYIPVETEKIATIKDGAFIPAQMQISHQVQEAVRRNKLSDSPVNLSLPTKEIIFRSFVIPWMQASELKGVIDFEVSKYIPFALKELSYAFHAVTIKIKEESVRRLRIIFVAIKKETLKTYQAAFEQAGMELNVIEPAPMSLLRALLSKEFLPADETVAIVEKQGHHGKIIIVNAGIPYFVRYFQLGLPNTEQIQPDRQAITTRLINEIRISLDYFNRQESQLEINDIFLIIQSEDEDLYQTLKDDLDQNVSLINTQTVLENTKEQNINYLNAYGASMFNTVANAINLSLATEKPKTAKYKKITPSKSVNYKLVYKVALVCVPVILVCLLLPQFLADQQIKKIDAIKNQLGAHKSSTTKNIQQQSLKLSGKLAQIKEAALSSDVSFFLSRVPELLPEGVWFQDFKISYPTPSSPGSQKAEEPKKSKQKGQPQKAGSETKENIGPVLMLSGYAYSEDPNEQFLLVNELVRNIKKDDAFSKHFKKTELKTVEVQKLQEYNTTFFKIQCE